MMVDWFIAGLSYNNSRTPSTDSRDHETEPEILETELRVSRIHDILGYRAY